MQERLLNFEEGRVYDWSELVGLGLDKERFIKNRIQGHIALMDQVVFHHKTYFIGFTFELVKNTKKFRAFSNELNQYQVKRLMEIRRIEFEIEVLENTIWAWKFDFTVPEKIPPLEAQLTELKDELLMRVKDTLPH